MTWSAEQGRESPVVKRNQDEPLLPMRLLTVQLELVPEAEAVYGHNRRTRSRGLAVGYTARVEAGREEYHQQQAAPPTTAVQGVSV